MITKLDSDKQRLLGFLHDTHEESEFTPVARSLWYSTDYEYKYELITIYSQRLQKSRLR